jgi:hypothetical protein
LIVLPVPEDNFTVEGTVQVAELTALPANAGWTEQVTSTDPLNPLNGVMAREAALVVVVPTGMVTMSVVPTEKDGDAVTVSGTVAVVVTVDVDADVAVIVTV